MAAVEAAPDRLLETEFSLGRCPVCEHDIVGRVEIEVRIVEVSAEQVPRSLFDTNATVQVGAKFARRLVAMHVSHECRKGANDGEG